MNSTISLPTVNPAIQVRTTQINTQQDAKLVTWYRAGRFYSRSPQTTNMQSYVSANAALQFDVLISQFPQGEAKVFVGCGSGCRGTIDLAKEFKSYGLNAKHTVKLPLTCFAAQGADLARVDIPFGVSASKPFSAAFTNIQIVAGAAKDADALKCDDRGR